MRVSSSEVGASHEPFKCQLNSEIDNQQSKFVWFMAPMRVASSEVGASHEPAFGKAQNSKYEISNKFKAPNSKRARPGERLPLEKKNGVAPTGKDPTGFLSRSAHLWPLISNFHPFEF